MIGNKHFLYLIISIAVIGLLRNMKKLINVNENRIKPGPNKLHNVKSISIYRDANEGIVACMIPDSCISSPEGSDHVLYIPENYQGHKNLLKSCVRPNLKVDFYNKEEPNFKMERIDVDVLGLPYVKPFYRHFAHYAPKVIAFSLLPASLFLARNRSIFPSCVSRDGEIGLCSEENKWPRNPRIVVEDTVINTRKGSWNQGFTTFLVSDSSQLHIVKHKEKTKNPIMCFRSAITSAFKYDGSIELHDRFLREKGVQRKNSLCKPHIVILFRDPKIRKDRTLPEETRSTFLKKTNDYLENSRFSATVEVINNLGSGRSFTEQKDVFSRADILVSVHGAEISNALFLRNGARLIEISPFGLFDGWFHNTLFAAGAREKKVCAPPDREYFMKCLKDRMVKRGENRSRLASSRAMKEFSDLEMSYKWLSRNTSCRLFEEDSQKCVRRQRILISSKQLNEIIVNELVSYCKNSIKKI